MPKLIVAIWSVNTKNHAATPDARFASLTVAIQSAWTTMMTLADGETVSYLGAQPHAITPQSVSVHTARNKSVNYLFIAPEYLFTANKDITSHFMTETQFELIRAQLVFLSLRFPNLMIIPGSAGWFKTRLRSAVKIFRKSLAQPQRERGPEASRDMNKYLERYQRSIDTPLDYRGVVPDRHLSSYTNQYKDLKYGQTYDLKQASPKSGQHAAGLKIAKNTCLVLKSATIIHRYDKIFEAQDSTDTDMSKADRQEPFLFMPGEASPIFESAGIKYGVELCVDHNFAALQVWCKKICHPPSPVDIQILMSASTGLESSNIAATQFVLHADCHGASVIKANGEDVSPARSAAEDLPVYVLEW
ncbi:TPA: hypothetical protein ACRNKK_003844 [Pseudomonas aeruginosa]